MQTNDVETAEQVAALESVIPALQGLRGLLAAEYAREIKVLENFASDAGLQNLAELAEQQRSEFDALDFVGRLRLGSGSNLWSDEEFHSNLLAWLLDPRESHGIGESFLTNFLRATCAPSEVQDADWTHARIIREWLNQVDGEWGYLDILILNESEQFLCAIENKVFSSEHSEQLTRYRKALAASYPDFTRHHVFLTPRGTLPYGEEEREYWTPATYAAVLNIVQQIVDDNSSPIKEDVRSFLRQYATTLRRNIVPDANTNVAQLARKIYMEHREAIDLIIRHKPDFVAEARAIFKEAIVLQSDWAVVDERHSLIRFRPMDWNRFIVPPNESPPLAFEFDWRWQDNHPRLGLVFDPENTANKSARDRLHLACAQNPHLFVGIQTLRPSWLWLLFTEPILGDSHYSQWEDEEAIRTTILDWVANFAENEFPAMNEVIVNCLREYGTEQDQ